MKNYRSLIVLVGVFAASFALAAASESSLVYHSRFDSLADVTNPTVGTKGSVDGVVTFVEGLDGNAVRIPTYGEGTVLIDLPNGLPLEKGRVEFDGKLEATLSYFVSAGNPTFHHICPTNRAAEIVNLAITSNNGVGKSGYLLTFAGQTFTTSDTFFGQSPYSDIYGEENPNDWHHYSYVWNTNGISGSSDMIRAYIDDRLVLHGKLSEDTMSKYVERMSQPLTMCLPRTPLQKTNNRVAFCVDELKIWSTDEEVSEEHDDGPISVSEVSAKQHYPWCGKIDITYKVSGATAGLGVKIVVRDTIGCMNYEAKTFDVRPTATPGVHTVVWNATADGVKKGSSAMVATVSLIVPE